MRILITGVNGFIGSWLAPKLLEDSRYHIIGIDRSDHNLIHQTTDILNHPNFNFLNMDLLASENQKTIEKWIQEVDCVIPLAAIANPYFYVKQPLDVFELDFVHNLQIIKWTVQYQKRLIFPSTSEVYGMSNEEEFHEDTSQLLLGPVHKMRWIYSSSKQLLDRVICAYGIHEGLNYTIFRPFNWMGPRLDSIASTKEGASRALTQFMSNLIHGRPLQIVGGGEQRRCFIYIEDALDALLRIIQNPENNALGQVFNIGNPDNDISILELANIIIQVSSEIPQLRETALAARIENISSDEYFGASYQDVARRIPSIEKAERLLSWRPETSLNEALLKTLEYYVGGNDPFQAQALVKDVS